MIRQNSIFRGLSPFRWASIGAGATSIILTSCTLLNLLPLRRPLIRMMAWSHRRLLCTRASNNPVVMAAMAWQVREPRRSPSVSLRLLLIPQAPAVLK
ncbi:MAG TPA: hypothetical protein VGN87_10120 [Paenibacillus sp.]